MSKTLIIAEKPSVAREIASALGGCSRKEDWLESDTMIVTSGIGHLVEITSSEASTSGRDLDSLPIIPKAFELQPITKTKSQFNLVKKLLNRQDVSEVVNACDAGREGELIFRLIIECAGIHKPMKRMWIQSMTTEAIREAYRSMKPAQAFDRLADAAKCRSEADWLIGINGSRGISQLRSRQTQERQVMSAGRVQTPTLAILVHREMEIKAFKPQSFWEIQGLFQAQAGQYLGKWINPQAKAEQGEEEGGNRFFKEADAQTIVQACQGCHPSSVKDESKPSSSSPPKLFDLTTLQREANKRFKFSAKKTLDIAQALYEKHKATSYPRTDASALPEDYVPKVKQIMGMFAGTPFEAYAKKAIESDWIKPTKRIFDNSKISDHFAIIPTGSIPTGLDADESKIYDMVVRRFIAAFYPAAQSQITTRTTIVNAHTFKSSGKVLVSPGWLEVYGQTPEETEAEDTPALCILNPGEAVQTVSVEAKAGKTKPPARYTEATLLGAMEGAGKLIEDESLRELMKSEAKGLGTPATRAAIIEGLLNAKDGKGQPKEPYIKREGKAQHLVPTSKGMELVQFLEQNGIAALCSPQMTGEWEQKLSYIEKGKHSRAAFMAEIAAMTENIISIIRERAATLPAMQPSSAGGGKGLMKESCPLCKSALQDRVKAVGCSKEGCSFVIWKTIAQRPLSDKEIKTLLANGKTAVLSGFVSKTGKSFSMALKFSEDYKVVFDFDTTPKAPNQDNSNLTRLNAPCPKCGSKMLVKGGDYPQYVCEKGDFKLWKEIARRPLSDKEAESLLSTGTLAPVFGFKSKAGKTFSAGLRLLNGKVEFEFDN